MRAADFHQSNFLGIAGLKAHGGSGGNIQPHAESGGAIESQRAIHFEEMEMRADLDGAVAGVGDFQFDFAAAVVGDHVAFRQPSILLESFAASAFRGDVQWRRL